MYARLAAHPAAQELNASFREAGERMAGSGGGLEEAKLVAGLPDPLPHSALAVESDVLQRGDYIVFIAGLQAALLERQRLVGEQGVGCSQGAQRIAGSVDCAADVCDRYAG